jgi:hypothetical protein
MVCEDDLEFLKNRAEISELIQEFLENPLLSVLCLSGRARGGSFPLSEKLRISTGIVGRGCYIAKPNAVQPLIDAFAEGIPDLILGNKIIEFKLCRPLRNNGELEGTWMTKIFDPIKNSGSAMADVLKMKQFRQNQDNNNKWELWVVIIGFEKHNENEYSLDMFFPNLFQYTSQNYLNVSHEEFINVTKEMSNRHQFHQTLKLYAFRY